MIKKLIRQMLTAQIFSALTVSLCLLIDSIVISRFLGEDALASYGYANPLLLAIGAVGTLLASGIQVVCSKALGRGNQEEANSGYSSALAAAACASLLFVLIVIPARDFFAGAMGAGRSGTRHELTADYLAGFAIGAPGSMGALVLVPFLQMAGQSGLLVAAVLTMTVTDVALDLINVYMLHWGMFGMGLASALSYYAAMAVAGIYLFSRRCVFRFRPKSIRKRMILNLFANGVPAGVNMAASVVLVFAMNRMLNGIDPVIGVAAYTVILSIGNAANCITTGTGGVSLTLSGIFWHEEDRKALREAIGTLCRTGAALGLLMCGLLMIFAPAMISVFIPDAEPTRDAAVLGLRLYGLGLIPCCVNNALKYHYQASGRILLSEGISLFEGMLFPAVCAFVLGKIFSLTGAWIGFAAGEALTLLSLMLLIRRTTGKPPWKDGAFLLLAKDFGCAEEDTLNLKVSSREEVAKAARAAGAFCAARRGSERECNRIALCVEEMAKNVVEYGFTAGKENHLSVLILNKEKQWVLRFRDDCKAFDPVAYVPQGEKRSIGIRLVMGITEEAYYTYPMGMNNLVLKVRKEGFPDGERTFSAEERGADFIPGGSA